VGATGLVPAAGAEAQLPLFEAPESSRRRRLNRALDAIADRFGPEAVRRAAQRAAHRAGLTQQVKRGEERSPR